MPAQHALPPPFCGLSVTTSQLELIKKTTCRYPNLSRTEIASTLCELLEWLRPNGKPKTVECRNYPERITIKYIFTDDNFKRSELQQFVFNMGEYELLDCNFLISADFKSEIFDERVVVSIIELFFLLYEKGAYGVSFDDHIYYRVREIGGRIESLFERYEISESLRNLYHEMARRVIQAENRGVVLWGTGEFSSYLLNSSESVHQQKIALSKVVDGMEEKWGSDFMGFMVGSPETIDLEKDYIVVASSNYYGQIVHRLLSMGFPIERVIPNFIL